jgi:biopolymer transport protein ExbD
MITGINVTPLVDIVLVLLIIFMVTANHIVRAQIGVDLPKAASGASELKTTLTFIVTADGKYAIADQVATLDDIAAFVRAEKKKDPEVRAVISADKGVEYGLVIDLIDTVKINGVERFALNIDRKAKPK